MADITPRILGLAGIAGGLALDAAFVPGIPWTSDTFNLRLAVLNLGAVAVVAGVTRLHSAAAPRAALLAAILAVLINAWHLVLIVGLVAQEGQIGPGDYGPVYGTAIGAMWLADTLFGVTGLRLGMARSASVAVAVGSALAFTPFLGLTGGVFAALFDPLALLGVALNGLGWIGLGLSLVIGPRAGATLAVDPRIPAHRS